MPVYSSLLSTIPIPEKQWQTKSETPVIASVKVGNVETETEKNAQTEANSSFLGKYIEKLKQKVLERRLKKLESIPEAQRTPAQKAEIEANNLSVTA